MPKCKNCGKNISKFDKNVCPYCGCKNPLDGNDYETIDITQTIDMVKGNDKFKQKSQNLNMILCIFLGIFGVDLFYLGFIKEAIIRIVINIVFFLIVFLPGFFLTNIGGLFALIPIGVLYLFYIVIALVNRFYVNKKDARGVFLK